MTKVAILNLNPLQFYHWDRDSIKNISRGWTRTNSKNLSSPFILRGNIISLRIALELMRTFRHVRVDRHIGPAESGNPKS